MAVDNVLTGGVGEVIYSMFYYILIFLGVGFILLFIILGVYYYLQATKYDIDVFIKRKGHPKLKKDKARYLKTEDGEILYLVKAKRYIHPEKIKGATMFREGSKKPFVYLYTEDMREFYPLFEEDYEIERTIEVDGKKYKIKGKGLKNVVNVDDRMVRVYGYEELKKSMERSKIENPFKSLIEIGKYAMIGIFFLIGLMIIVNSMKDFSKSMQEMTQESLKTSQKIAMQTQYLYNFTDVMLEKQNEYVREIRRMTEGINNLVEQVRKEQELLRQLYSQQNIQQNITGG